MRRPTNRELIQELREHLTTGAASSMSPEVLAATKEWRGKLWKYLPELEDRLDPLAALAKEKARKQSLQG